MKKNICQAQGCDNPVWSGEMCQRHQYLREDIADIKREGVAIKRQKRLKRVSKKRLAKLDAEYEENRAMKLFFADVWENTPVKMCMGCGVWLGLEPLTYMFDHLLQKDKYPHLKYEKDNIFICCLECHDRKGKGYPTVNHEEAIQRAREKFLI